MYLIVDSGSTKTDWYAVNQKGEVMFSTQTLGLNPQVLSSAILNERIINNYQIYQNRDEVTHLYFYGAGCGVKSTVDRILKVFKEIFIHCEFIIKEDTYAAVYSTTEKEEAAIVCILGTGSNCSYFDGKDVYQHIISLGYILMDEASGNFFGKQLVRGFYFNEMPENLAKKFNNEFDLDADKIKDNLYRKENPNTYLARFAQFLIAHKNDPYMQKIIKEGLDRFVRHQIFQFDNAKDVPIHFVGSIAHFLKEEIKTSLDQYGLKLGKVVKRPIDGLVNYHISLLDLKCDKAH
ncbi:MAG: N-acetylglucosamine kinase [Flavobacteriaceae bacterium]